MYSEKFKNRVVRQMMAPNGKRASELSQELGVASSTLSRWRKQAQARTLREPMLEKPRKAKRESDWSAQEKLEFLLKAAACNESDLGALLRRQGVHEATYRQWRDAALTGLTGPTTRAANKSAREDKKRVRRLEREVRRKDKALAEAAALLVLQKKFNAMLEEEDGSTTPTSV